MNWSSNLAVLAMHWDVNVWNVMLGLLTVLVTGSLCLQSWQRSSDRRWAAPLECLRAAVILLALATLFQPRMVRTEIPARASVVRVLCDDSASMKTADVSSVDGRIARDESVAALRQPEWWKASDQNDYQIDVFSAGDQIGGTDLNGALTEVADNPQGVRAVVLASDGDWNQGASPVAAARKLRELDIPVFTVVAGSDQPLPDVGIDRFDVPTFAIVGKPVRIPFSVSNTLPHPVVVPVTIKLPGVDPRIDHVEVPAFGTADSVVSWRPRRIGDETISIAIEPRPDDSVRENNLQSAVINVRYESLKVLMIDTYPRWEYRYTRNALMRDPGVTVNTLLLQPDFDGVGGGPGYLARFPADQALFEYDVVFLGDVGVGPGQLTLQNCESLRQLVSSQAGGLVLLPGFRGFQSTLADSPLEALSPVRMDPGQSKGQRSATSGHFRLTEAGRRSLLTRFTTDQETNADIWQALPGFNWHAAALRSKPGTTTLAVHDSVLNRFGRVPLIVTGTMGSGKILFVGSDGAWRWRKGVEDLYHYRFWSQMVRWMAYQRTMSRGKSLRVVFHPDRPRVGDTVMLRVNAMSESGEPLQQGNLTTQIEDPSGATRTLNLSKDDKDAWGLFLGSFVAKSGGQLQLRTRCEETGASLETTIHVTQSPLEQVGGPARSEVMREIAAITNGQMVRSSKLQDVVAAVNQIPDRDPIVRRVALWSHPLWAAALVGLLGLFWTGRKYAGLV